MNKKGFVTSGIAMLVMLSSLALLAVFYSNVTAHNLRIKTEEQNIETFIERRTAQERVYGVLTNDFANEDAIVYSDNDIRIGIEELSETSIRRVLTLTPVWVQGETTKELPAYKIAVERLSDETNQPITITILETGIKN